MENNIARTARLAIGMTTAEAAQLVHVTRRAWELWEAGDRAIPAATLELFIAKITMKTNPPARRELIVVSSEDLVPIDVLAEDTFLDLVQTDANLAEVSSLAINKLTGRPYVHRTTFKISPNNKHVVKGTNKWKAASSKQA